MPSHPTPHRGLPPCSARPAALHPAARLAFTASHSPLYANTLALARWTGPAVPVTARGIPELSLVREAVEVLALQRDGERPGPGVRRPDRFGSPSGTPAFDLPWWEAVRLGMLEVRSGRARPAPDLEERSRDPDQVLRWWTDMFETTVECWRGDLAALEPDSTDVGLLPRVLRVLYDAPDRCRMPLEQLTDALLPEPGLSEHARSRLPDLLRCMFSQLGETGAVRAGRLSPVPERGPGSPYLVRLTPLGRYGVRGILLASGVPAPLVEDFAKTDAATFLDSLSSFSDDGRLIAVDTWTAARAPARVLWELSRVVDGPGLVLRRREAARVIGTVCSELVPQLRSMASSGRPALSALAAAVLVTSGMLDQAEVNAVLDQHAPWVMVDITATALAEGEDPVDFLSGITEGLESVIIDNADLLARSEHPDALRVLDALARHHPDPGTAARAREAADLAWACRSRGRFRR